MISTGVPDPLEYLSCMSLIRKPLVLNPEYNEIPIKSGM